MLTLLDRSGRFCDSISRRSFLQIGGLALGGLSFPQILRAQQQNKQGASHKAVIMVFLAGGPPHQDMFDLKPAAPVEVRGEFRPIATKVSGIQISELMPPRRREHGQVRRHPVARRRGRATRFVRMLHGAPFSQQSTARGMAVDRFVAVEIEGAGRSGGPALHRPVAQDGTRPLEYQRARLPGDGPFALPSRRGVRCRT